MFEIKSSCRRVARQCLQCYTAVARLGFRLPATAVLRSNLFRSVEFGTAVSRRLKRALSILFVAAEKFLDGIVQFPKLRFFFKFLMYNEAYTRVINFLTRFSTS